MERPSGQSWAGSVLPGKAGSVPGMQCPSPGAHGMGLGASPSRQRRHVEGWGRAQRTGTSRQTGRSAVCSMRTGLSRSQRPRPGPEPSPALLSSGSGESQQGGLEQGLWGPETRDTVPNACGSGQGSGKNFSLQGRRSENRYFGGGVKPLDTPPGRCGSVNWSAVLYAKRCSSPLPFPPLFKINKI